MRTSRTSSKAPSPARSVCKATSMDLLDRLLGHDKWTTDELLRRSQELSAGQWDQRFDIGWESVHRTFAHVIENERLWTELIASRNAEHVTDGWWDYSLAELTAAHDS